ncbi:MAG: hypothetical protein E7487_07770 [Ruminococcaceae bacterium]|nr:hypothetical protein [Oscillospiraceae bacterium]
MTKYSKFVARLFLITVIAATLVGCGNKPQIQSIDVSPKKLLYQQQSLPCRAVCFSEDKALLQGGEGWDKNHISKILSLNFTTGETETLFEENGYLDLVAFLDSKYVYSVFSKPDKEETYPNYTEYFAVMNLEDGTTMYEYIGNDPEENQAFLIGSKDNDLLPCELGYAIRGVEQYGSDHYTNVSFMEQSGSSLSHKKIINEKYNGIERKGKRFLADISDGCIWLLSEHIQDGHDSPVPIIEKYDPSGKLIETRKIADWEKTADKIAQRYGLDYEVGAIEFALTGKDGKYLYINYQVDVEMFELKNGKYYSMGSPFEDTSAGTMIKQVSRLCPACSGCENQTDEHRDMLYLLERNSETLVPKKLYLFDPSSAVFYFIDLMQQRNIENLITISINCNGDILMQYAQGDPHSQEINPPLENVEYYFISGRDIAEKLG